MSNDTSKDMVRMAEFAEMHGITWSAVNYLIRRDIVDHIKHRGRRYVVMTPKTHRYTPNTKHK